jgi:hypothetical protein
MAEAREVMPIQSELMTLDKKGLEAKAKAMAEELADSGWGVLGYLSLAKRMGYYLEEVIKALKEKGVSELRTYKTSDHGKGGLMLEGVQMQEATVGTTYTYDSDPVWCDLKDIEDKAAAARKAWEVKLKAIKKLEGEYLTDERTGETYLAHRPGKKSTESIKLQIV